MTQDMLGLEKMNYDAFVMKSTVRRPSQVPSFSVPFDTLTLPNNSVLHTFSNQGTMEAPVTLNVGIDSPLIKNEKWPIFLWLSREMAGETSRPLPVTDSHIFRQSIYNGQISAFYQTHRHIHRLMSLRNLGNMTGNLLWFDYTPLQGMVVTGTYHIYRKWDMILRTILDRAVSIGTDKHHFIHFPQGDQLFSRGQMIRAYSKIWKDTFPYEEDATIYPVLHLLALVYGITHTLDVKPYRTDKALWDRDHVDPPELKSSSLFGRLSAEQMASINLIFTKDNTAVVMNLGKIVEFAQDPSFYARLYQEFVLLRNIHQIPDLVKSSEEPDAIAQYVDTLHDENKAITDTATTVTPESETVSTPSDRKSVVRGQEVVTPTVVPESTHKPVLDKVVSSVEDITQKTSDRITAQSASVGGDTQLEQKADALLNTHMNTLFMGKPLQEHLTPLIRAGNIDKTIPDVGYVTEKSFTGNTVRNFDNDYARHGHYQDIAKVIATFPKHGMYVKDIKHDVISTELDRLETFKISLTDTNGRQHSVVAQFPVVDAHGHMLIGGVKYHMTRQAINTPICKVSDTRVSLTSNYNKSLVERVSSVRSRFDVFITKYIYQLKTAGILTYTAGSLDQGEMILPFDYSAIGHKFSTLSIADYRLIFDYPNRLTDLDEKVFILLEEKYGTYIGTGPNGAYLFMDQLNAIHVYRGGKLTETIPSITSLLANAAGDDHLPPPISSEWTQLKLLSKSYPLVMVLGYRFGLQNVLKMINLEYTKIPKGQKVVLSVDDIAVPFADCTLVFNRYPLSRSLIASGLNWANLSKFSLVEMEAKDTYSKIFTQKGLSVNYLKGIDNFFEFFVDPITLEVLQEMHEPTNVKDLLLRASVMLTDYSHMEPSAIRNQRFRGYERFASYFYNEIARELANKRGNITDKKSFSINPQAIFLQIAQDQTVSPVNVMNPIQEVRDRHMFTYTGAQGRTSTSFVNKDRVFAQDALGVISENTPDSGKVGITGYLSIAPRIKNLRGMVTPAEQDKLHEIRPGNVLGVTGVLMPGVTKDDLYGLMDLERIHHFPLN